ncbi:MAG: hypothetical protein AAGF71_12870 [Pseudomonadota bacterium]
MKYQEDFRLRKGAGGSVETGLCVMETVALIAGEDITDHPECACPVLTSYAIGLNDTLPDEERQKLLPLAVMIAGTRSAEHELARLKNLAVSACCIARLVAPLNDDPRVIRAIEAAERHWLNPNPKTACAVTNAAFAAVDASYAARKFVANASANAARAVSCAASRAAEGKFVRAARDAAIAAHCGSRAAGAATHLRPTIQSIAISALRDAILAGPYDGIAQEMAQARVDKAFATV